MNNIYEYGVYGKTVKHRLYAGDKNERYFHLYHSISKESAERAGIENRLNQMTLYLKKYQNKVKEFGPGFEKYFNLHYDEKTQAFVLPEERCSVVERELDLAGYFCIITSEKMSAKEANYSVEINPILEIRASGYIQKSQQGLRYLLSLWR